MGKRRHVAACLAALALAGGSAPALASPCRPAALESAAAASTDERLEITLADGRLIRLAGLESPLARGADADALASAAGDLALWASAPLGLAVLKGRADRWGRIEARVFVGEGAVGEGAAQDALPSLSEAMVEAGLARVDPATERRPCLDALYAAERRARAAGRGLWADSRFAVIEPGAPDQFAGQAGRMAIVEGTVASVRAGRGLTFVNLGSGAPGDPALTISREAARAMEREGVRLAALEGRLIRARGVLDLRPGPRIEVAGPGAVEVLPAPRRRL